MNLTVALHLVSFLSSCVCVLPTLKHGVAALAKGRHDRGSWGRPRLVENHQTLPSLSQTNTEDMGKRKTTASNLHVPASCPKFERRLSLKTGIHTSSSKNARRKEERPCRNQPHKHTLAHRSAEGQEASTSERRIRRRSSPLGTFVGTRGLCWLASRFKKHVTNIYVRIIQHLFRPGRMLL